jgi:hypothetical protein
MRMALRAACQMTGPLFLPRDGVGEGKSIFPEGIKSGFLKHTAYEVIGTQSAPLRKCRLGDDEAPQRRHVWGANLTMCWSARPMAWKDGGWGCVLTHEAWEGAEKDQKELSR